MASSLTAIAAGTTCGIFTLGMLFPWANSTGAIVGAISGSIMSGLVSFGGQFVAAAKQVVPHRLPVYVKDICFEKYGINRNISIPEVGSIKSSVMNNTNSSNEKKSFYIGEQRLGYTSKIHLNNPINPI